MYNNLTHSPPSHPFSFKFEAPSHGSAFYVAILSTTVVVSILSPLSVVTNGLILAAIWRKPSLRTPSYVLIAGLALTDLGTGLITQPIYVTSWFIYALQPHMSVVDDKAMFVIGAMTHGSTSFFSTVTIFLMTVMSIERWLHMSRRSLINVRRACFIVVILVLFSIPITAFRVFQNLNQVATPGFDVAAGLIVPFLFTATSISYFKIFRIIRRHQQQIRTRIESPKNFAQSAINLTKYKKSVFSILCVLVVFYMGYVPITISMRISTVLVNERVVIFVNFMFMFLSSSLNPLLYLWRMGDIRNEVKLLVKRVLHKEN